VPVEANFLNCLFLSVSVFQQFPIWYNGVVVEETLQRGRKMTDTLIETFTKGETLYWQVAPKAKFRFVKMNPDGSVQMVGGENGYSMGRDARVSDVSKVPFEGTERIGYWATKNLYAEVVVKDLAERFGLTEAVVRKFVTDRPDVFKRVAHGKYEVRDAEADRAFARDRVGDALRPVKRQA
jgi:hypothetical protein